MNEARVEARAEVERPCLYTPLGPSDIRLVDIMPGRFDDPIKICIRTVDLRSSPLYAALSYVWNPKDGTTDASSQSRTVDTQVSRLYAALSYVWNPEDGITDASSWPETVKVYPHFTMKVKPNLAAAMRQLRLPNSIRTMWIDAICINQSNDMERNQQVALMGKIYSSAAIVLIWLGPERDFSSMVLDTIDTGRLEVRNIESFMVALELLLRRDWFGRVWVAQELALASREPLIMCGTRCLGWSRFSAAVRLVRARILNELYTLENEGKTYLKKLDSDNIFKRAIQSVHAEDYSYYDEDVPQSVASKALRVSNLAEIRAAGRQAKFSEQLQRTLYMQATDARDRVFALVGLSTFMKQALVADYTKDKERVAAETTALLVQDDLVGYMTARLWEYKRYGSGFAKDYHRFAGIPEPR